MKKNILKIGFVVVVLAVILFLLLPFLQTTSPASSSLNAATPQIVSSNPLTAIMRRLSSLFGKKEKKALQPSTASYDEQNSFSSNSAQYAWNQPEGEFPQERNPFNQTVSVPQEEQPYDYADAAFQTDAGEWVLIRQTAPQNSAPGMHEVNVHDNPYDRYIKQERAQHFARANANTQEIPDSMWARIARPFKYLFLGDDGPRQVGASPVQVHRSSEGAALLASASNKLGTGNKNLGSASSAQRASMPDISSVQWAKLTPAEKERVQERHAAVQFSQLLSGEKAAEQSAEIAADTKFPNPKNEQEQQEKERYKKEMLARNKQLIEAGLLQNIQNNAADKEVVDELSYMTGCANSSLPSTSESCGGPDTPLPSRLPQDVLLKAQLQNAENFYNTTEYVLPKGLPFTVVLGPTDLKNLENMASNPSTQPTGEVYVAMAQQQRCDSRPCYWIPNTKQLDPQLADTFATINDAHLKEDPLHLYATFAEPFIQSKIAQLGKDATPEQIKQVKTQAVEQFTKNRPNWVPYTQEQIIQMHQNTKKALASSSMDGATSDPIFPFVTDPAIAPEMARLIGPASFVYNNISLVNAAETPIAAGGQLTSSLGQNVNDAKHVFNEVTKGAVTDSMREKINSQINTQNQTGGGFAGLLNFVKNKPATGTK